MIHAGNSKTLFVFCFVSGRHSLTNNITRNKISMKTEFVEMLLFQFNKQPCGFQYENNIIPSNSKKIVT